MIKKQPSREAISNSQNNQSLKNTQNSQKQPALHQSPSTKKLFQKGACVPEFQRPFHSRHGSNSNGNPNPMSDSMAKTQKTVHLHQRLKNLHLFYKNKIQDEKNQTIQRNNVFLSIIEEMQRNHQEKVQSLRKMIEQAQSQKKDVGSVDEKMGDITGSIDQILKQSTQLKASNQQLQREINSKEIVLRQKQEELTRLQQELVESRNELQSFELLNLKENKRNKEIISIIDTKTKNLEQ